MAKISKILWSTLFATSASANDNFKVASCNDDSPDRRPELTIQVAEDFYTNNLSGQDGFALTGGFYSKSIPEDDLNFEFSDDADEIILSYTLDTGSSATDFLLDDSTTISFGESSIRFQCRYSRSVSVSQDMTVLQTPTDAIEGTGDFSYSMSITVGGPGGNTDVTITPNHNFDEISPRLINCNVSHNEHTLYPIHSFENDQLCFDKSRLNVMQTVFGANIEFSMRTFLFKTQGSSADEQQQTISCNLHLDPATDVSSTEPDDCSCYSEEECAEPAGFTNLGVHPDGQEYQQRTLSSGKRLLYASYQRSTYQQAEEICASHGAEIVLPTEDENTEVRLFLRETRFAATGGNSNAFVRVANLGAPSFQNWVDAKDLSPLLWDGDRSHLGGNAGIWDYSYDTATRGFIEPNTGTWKGFVDDPNDPYPEVICELPSL